MSTIMRLIRSLEQRGLWFTFIKFYIMVVDWLYDIQYGIDTCREVFLDTLSIQGDNRSKGTTYVPTRVLVLRKLFCILKPYFRENSVFVDFGSGKGRVLFVASEFGIKEARGIEFAHELSEIAKQNSKIYKAKTGVNTEFKNIEADVTSYRIQPDEDIFFLNNPFEGAVLKQVLDNISSSLSQYNRRIYIIYFIPSEKDVIESRKDYKKIREGNIWEYDFILYSNL